MTTLFTEDFCCPICGHQFEDTVIGSTNTFGGVETDFHPHAVGFDPLPYYIHQCPKCHFAFMGDSFPVIPRLTNHVKTKKLFKGIRPDRLKERHTMYEIFARALKHIKATDEKIGWAYLRASWMARTLKDRKNERRLQLESIQYFKKAIEERTLERRGDSNHVRYLIGELYRRTGRFKEAIEYFPQGGRPRKTQAKKQLELAKKGVDTPTFFK